MVVARSRAVDAARAKADQYRWGAQVKVDAVGSASRVQRTGGDNRLPFPEAFNSLSAGVRLTIPFYTGGGLSSQQRQAAAQSRSAEQMLEAARRDVRLNVQQAWIGQSSSVAGISALRTALASAELQERAAATGREIGIRTQSDVLAAQAQVFDTKRRLNDALRDYERSRVALSAATGSLDETVLAEIDQDLGDR
ncbi:TolC family protein [Sphingomonas sp. PL-96]|uniref:TolC family protein n=1 Tax=Sphingomonas sp. PL-96 TaxID=2887201 RepID=UPI001E5ACB08|nr:TolC family protein [Sphingomonas sp. PL-96]MCC2978247.1 TolC family protein [Sphingomonas sp. PL-96]